jgi:hypothetical protein
VIEEGTEPRQTISIVEVQKRGSKPEINDFNGWIVKMRDVGAQHLICVSALGFPVSIEEKADQIGPTVRLLTLKQIEEDNWPIPPSFCSGTLEVVRYDQLVGLQIKYQHLVQMDPHASKKLPNPHEKIFRIEDGCLVSVTDIMDWHLFGNPNNLAELPRNQQITLGVNITGGLEHRTYRGDWVKIDSFLIQIDEVVKLNVTDEIANTKEPVPLKNLFSDMIVERASEEHSGYVFQDKIGNILEILSVVVVIGCGYFLLKRVRTRQRLY